jgi:carnitine-CoA ligase
LVDSTPSTLGALLTDRASAYATRPFLLTNDATVTYGSFEQDVNRLARALSGVVTSRQAVVASLLHNRPECVQLAFACARIGVLYAPLNTSFRGPGLRHMIELVAPEVIVMEARTLPFLAEVLADVDLTPAILILVGERPAGRVTIPHELVDFDDFLEGGPTASTITAVAVGPLDPCMVLFTSGTTGRSKACVLSHRYVIGHAQLMSDHYGFDENDRYYCPYPLYHIDAAVLTVMPALLFGSSAAIGERFSASRFWDEIRRFEATVFDFMGATLTMLWKRDPCANDIDNPARLGWGVPMPPFAADFEQRFGLRLIENYGLTDAGVPIYPPRSEARTPGSCGMVVKPFDVRIFDENDLERPSGEVGEIVIRSEDSGLIMKEYYRDPDATQAVFRNDWFHTGDLASRDSEGRFYFVGRKKESIRRRGENISAFEVEEVANLHPAVLESAAIGIPSDLTEDEVKLVVVPRPGHTIDPSELLSFCEARMANFMVPRYIEIVDTLPKTPTMKIEKYRLVEFGLTPTTWDREAFPANSDRSGKLKTTVSTPQRKECS